MKLPGPWRESHHGYCLGTATHWISCCYPGLEFPFVVNRICRMPPWKAIRAQNLSERSNSFLPERVTLHEYQLTVNLGRFKSIWFQKPNAEFIFSIALYGYGFCLVLLRRRSTGDDDVAGAHAIATWHSRDKNFHLFDANFGHFKVPRLQAMNFLDFYLENTPYPEYFVTQCITSARP